MKKKHVALILKLIIASFPVFCKETLTAEKEILGTIEIGDNESELYLHGDGESFGTAIGPYINDEGSLFFYNRNKAVVFKNNLFTFPEINEFPFTVAGSFSGQNIDGYILNGNAASVQRICENGLKKIKLKNMIDIKPTSLPGDFNESEYIVLKNGLIIDFHDNKVPYDVLVVDIDKNGNTKLIDEKDKIQWLKSNNLELGSDGNLYRNGFLFSALTKETYRPVARLRSGHILHVYHQLNRNYQDRFAVCRPDGTIELIITIPWSYSDESHNHDKESYYDWGFGNYGELYALVYPSFDKIKGDVVSFDEGEAELVVVRNYLKYFGILTDDRIRLRKEASTSSESLGTYPKNTGFYIIERGTKEETIGSDKGIWYHVRLLDGKEGWFFGAYVRDLYEGPGTPLPWPNAADWD